MTSTSKLKGFKHFAKKWQTKTPVWLGLLGFVYLGVYSTQVLDFNNTFIAKLSDNASLVIWLIFAFDVVVNFLARKSFGKFLQQNWLEIFALALPLFRVLRVFRVVLAVRGIKSLVKGRAKTTVAYIAILLPLIVYSAAIAMLDAERGSSTATITDLRQSLWWALSTITTVGYGDKYPTTEQGQFIAGALMLVGITLFSAAAGVFASWILKEGQSSSTSIDELDEQS